MGRRARRRRGADTLAAPESEYADAHGNVLVLRGALSPTTRREYAAVRAGLRSSAAAAREDDWQRAVEFLFERLAVRWVIAGAPIERQKELLARYRVASPGERGWIRETLRLHCAEHFPDVEAP